VTSEKGKTKQHLSASEKSLGSRLGWLHERDDRLMTFKQSMVLQTRKGSTRD